MSEIQTEMDRLAALGIGTNNNAPVNAISQQNRAGHDFTPPPPINTFQMHIYGEIIKTSGFEDETLYLEYEMHIPNHNEHWWWSPDDKHQRDQAITQISDAVQITSDIQPDGPKINECYFGFPIEMELIGRSNVPIKYPTIYFQVNSLDRWGSHRVVGYGYQTLPCDAGEHELVISTWKPVGSIRSQLSSFFVGGSPALRDVKMSGIPDDLHASVMNRYGFLTEGTGQIHLRLSIILSHHAQIVSQENKQIWKSAFKSLKQQQQDRHMLIGSFANQNMNNSLEGENELVRRGRQSLRKSKGAGGLADLVSAALSKK